MDQAQPFSVCRLRIAPEWIDYNGHMNVGFYGVAFDKASDALLDFLDLGEDYRRRTDASMFIVEAHLTYDQEVSEGAPLRFETQIVDADEKRLHMFHAMYHDTEGYLAATTELMGLHVSLEQQRAAAFSDETRARIAMMVENHRQLPRPTQCGRIIGIRRKTEA
jgi:acyl-CoA thioester hydrolase